jgi:soluble lytic murein transglycosylase-like protein
MAPGTRAFLKTLNQKVTVALFLIVLLIAGGLANQHRSIPAVPSVVADVTDTVPMNASTASVPDVDPKALTPAMKAALEYVVQRYRVSADALKPVFEAAQVIAHERQLDPMLLIAVISIESRFNPFSQSPMGAQGLMQIMPRYHQDKLPDGAGDRPFLDPVINVRIGAQILHESIRRYGGLIPGLQSYAGALGDDEQAYASKVLAEKQRLDQASRRRDGPAGT